MKISRISQGIHSISQSYFEGLKDLQEPKSLSQTVLGLFKCLSYITLITPLVLTALYWVTRKVEAQPASEADLRVRNVFNQSYGPRPALFESTELLTQSSQPNKEDVTPIIQEEEQIQAEASSIEPIHEFNAESQASSLPQQIGSLNDSKSQSFEEGLALWVQREGGGRAHEAARRIREAYNSQTQQLDLSRLGLKSLPGQIGRLTQLTHLKLGSNQLTSLPAAIGRLTQLTCLELSFNQLSSFPVEIGNLTQLTQLYLVYNRLSSLPAEIGNLTQLISLVLGCNQLSSLPAEIGRLSQLGHLSLESNPLTELPLSLGQYSRITCLDIEGTDISDRSRNEILNLCRAQREEDALDVLPTRLKAWATYASQDLFDYSIYKEKLTESQLKTLNEWLLRLEKTSDFSSCQGSLAQGILGILETVLIDEFFKESFFNQVEANNEACGDRAAMALNEIFVSWKLATLSSSQSSIEDKLKLMAQTGRTLALREALQQKLNKLPDGGGNESVQIYLYYETALKDRLNLLTAVSTMRYSAMGNRPEIQESELIEEVQKTYLDHLVDIPAFKSLVDKDLSFQERWKLYEDELSTKMGELEDRASSMRQQDYVEAMDNLSFEREVQWKKMACEWASSLVRELAPQAREGSLFASALVTTRETGTGTEGGT